VPLFGRRSGFGRRMILVVTIYSAAEAYEIAFNYRNIPAEADALLRWAAPPVTSVLELAAGPAEHAREFASRGMRATALDLSPAMAELAARRAREDGVILTIVVADMAEFALDRPVDLAFCMIDSVAHLLTLDELVSHLRCVRGAVRPGGTYVIEGSHPAEVLDTVKRVESEWDSHDGDRGVHIRWGHHDDRIDPVTQVTAARVELTMSTDGHTMTWTETVSQRFWTVTETVAAAQLAGFDVAGQYGDFEHDLSLADEGAWRMITVLRRPR
jgi:SAM-dependent methyltransferase